MSEKQSEPVILSAIRTPIGRFQGMLSRVPAPELGAIVVKGAVERAGITNLDDIDEVLMGNVVSAGLGQNPARQAAIFGELPPSVGATTVNKVCGSGLKTVMLAAQAIRAGDGDLFVAGGMENMSRAPFLVEGVLANYAMDTRNLPTPCWSMACGILLRIGAWGNLPSSSLMNMGSRGRPWISSLTKAT